MIDTLLSHVAPHLCCACGKTGTILCENCKYNIENDSFNGCLSCGKVYVMRNSCDDCNLPYSRAWCVGERSGELRKLIDDFKFENLYAAHKSLASLLDARIEQLPSSTIIVPVPTITSHIRQRGYDHTLLIARALAKKRGVKARQILRRVTSSSQRGADKATRITQAKAAFAVNKKVNDHQPYLLVDDITTTGATLKYAARALRDAGAKDVWVAVVARQPLD